MTNKKIRDDFNEKKGYYTSHEIVSKSLDETPINFTHATSHYNEDFAGFIPYDTSEIKVKIERGKFIEGVLDKKSIGKSAGSWYHEIFNEYGPEAALESIYNMQQMAINYLDQFGYTIGIMDLLVSKDALAKIHQIESEMVLKSKLIS